MKASHSFCGGLSFRKKEKAASAHGTPTSACIQGADGADNDRGVMARCRGQTAIHEIGTETQRGDARKTRKIDNAFFSVDTAVLMASCSFPAVPIPLMHFER